MNLVCRLRGGEISTRPSDPQAALGAPLDFSGLAATAVGSACWPARMVRRQKKDKVDDKGCCGCGVRSGII